jgi:hypothetical protein
MNSYFVHHQKMLEHPVGIPFHQQASPIPDYQQTHVVPSQIKVATEYTSFDPFPFSRFFGLSTKQVHRPQFLSLNTTIYDNQ